MVPRPGKMIWTKAKDKSREKRGKPMLCKMIDKIIHRHSRKEKTKDYLKIIGDYLAS